MYTAIRLIPSAPRALTAAAITLSSAGCTTMGSAQDLDAKFAAGWRPSKGYCAFGAETAALSSWCAEVNYGGDGLLAVARAVNEQVLASAGSQKLSCTEHVAHARQRMQEYPDYVLTDVYSCSDEPVVEQGRAVCHVSLMVTTKSGNRVVLDNGYVLEPGTTGGVAAHLEFAAQVDRHWVGRPPAGIAVPTLATER